MNKNKIIYGLIALIILNFIDAIITIAGINSGYFIEANPIVRYTMTSAGSFYIFKVIIPTIFIVITAIIIDRSNSLTDHQIKIIIPIIAGTLIFYIGIIMWAIWIFLIASINKAYGVM